MKTNKRVMEIAYCEVNGLTRSKLKETQHQKAMYEALVDVWSYSGLYQGENDTLRDKRLDMSGPENGEVTELAQHFKELYPNDFDNSTTWAVIFTMYNRLKGLESSSSTKEKEEDKPSDILNEEKENEEMSEKTTTKKNEELETNLASLENIEAGLSTADKGSFETPSGSNDMPTSVDEKVRMEIGRSIVESEGTTRLQYSKTAMVTKFVLNKPVPVEIATDGVEAKGTIYNLDKTYEQFKTKTGLHHDESGNPVFDNVESSSLDDAKNMYEVLVKAKSNPELELDVYFNENALPTIKGFKLTEDKGGDGSYMTRDDLILAILQKAASYLKTPSKNINLATTKVTASKTKIENKGTGTQSSKNKNQFSGVLSLKIENKKEGIEKYGVYYQEVDKKNTKVDKGFKSALKIKYKLSATNTDGTAIIRTYRLPLNVKQYMLKNGEDELIAVFGQPGSHKGGGAKMPNVHDEAEVLKLMKDMGDIAGMLADSGIEIDIFKEIKEKAGEELLKNEKKEADELADMNL